jgi:hypothetical protein
VFADVEKHKGDEYILLGLIRDDGATNIARKTDKIVLYQRKGAGDAKKAME